MIKAIFFDLDGTLLDTRKQILPSSVESIKKCKENGIHIFISTARSPMLDKMLSWGKDTMSLFNGGIFCNGSVIKTDRVIKYTYIDSQAVKAVAEIVNSYDSVHMAVHLTDDRHAFNHSLPERMLQPWGLERSAIAALDKNAFDQTAKIIIYYDYLVDSETPLPPQLYNDIKGRISECANIYLQDKGRTIQLAAKNISKLSAIRVVCQSYGFSDDEIAVFGDDVNDMEMLSGFKNSVAMGNASENVKQVAQYITRSNDDDGIAYAIGEILKLI